MFVFRTVRLQTYTKPYPNIKSYGVRQSRCSSLFFNSIEIFTRLIIDGHLS